MEYRLFVYGTLQPGERYYGEYCAWRVREIVAAKVRGDLFHLPMDGYPALTPGHGWVLGYLLTFFDSRVLEDLDLLEGVAVEGQATGEYTREMIETFSLEEASLGFAWVYRMGLPIIKERGGVLLTSGRRWSEADCAG